MTDSDGTAGAIQVDIDLVKKLAELLNESDLSEIEVQDGDRKIVVKRKLGAPAYYVPPAPGSAPVHATAPLAADAISTVEATPASHAGTVTSPMVGTVYLSSDPASSPFVAAGDRVSAGDTLLIVEAMKVMNPITAPAAGIVRQILVENAQPVEFDQPLVIIE